MLGFYLIFLKILTFVTISKVNSNAYTVIVLRQSTENSSWHATKVQSTQFDQLLLLLKLLSSLILKQLWKKEKLISSSAPDIDLVEET